MFVYKHAETIEYGKKSSLLFKKIPTSWVNNSRILSIKNANFSGYCLYMNLNLQ